MRVSWVLVTAAVLVGAVGAMRAATRLDRLHVRTDAAWAALDAALGSRAHASLGVPAMLRFVALPTRPCWPGLIRPCGRPAAAPAGPLRQPARTSKMSWAECSPYGPPRSRIRLCGSTGRRRAESGDRSPGL